MPSERYSSLVRHFHMGRGGMGWEGMGDVDHTYHTWFLLDYDCDIWEGGIH